MEPELLEREPLLAQLATLLRKAAGGAGHTILISGEAGIGKTTLVERFTERQRMAARPLWGACELLFTPRPLGPLHDIAYAAGGTLRALLEGGTDRGALFAALLDVLRQQSQPSIVVFEDVHWADEATLDLIKFLGRRMHQLPALFILTYRDDETGRDHPLTAVLGDLPARTVTRLRLPPLSEAGVATLARAARRSAEQLYAVTGGNAFFVTEVLASATPGVPVTVRDAVLARVARLPGATRRVVELISVAPSRMEREVVKAVAGADGIAALDRALATGMLRQDEDAVAFRHELARQAVESMLTPQERRALHARVLTALLIHEDEQASKPAGVRVQVARLVHHAEHAGDRDRVLRYAPEAALEAAQQGAHREAAAHYATALRYGAGLPAARRAELNEALAYQCYLTSQGEQAIQAREAALAIWSALGNQEKMGHNLRWLSRLSWFLTRATDAARYAEEAVRLLETLPPGTELAMAYSNRAQLAMLAYENASALRWGERAVALAEWFGDTDILAHALNNMGTALLDEGDERGWEQLEHSLRLALEHGFEEHAARAYTNLACQAVMIRDDARALRYLDAGIDYCTERDLDAWWLYMLGWRARARLQRGDWAAADEDATAVLSNSRAYPASRIPALTVLGVVRARRGDPGVWEVLDEARERAQASSELQRIGPVAAARAEAAWIQGDRARSVAEAQPAFTRVCANRNAWIMGELAVWMWRGGALAELPDGAAEPFALSVRGDWRSAADAWHRLGCPYERALALAEGDELAQREALALFELLGARPATEITRQRLRERGARNVGRAARGPRTATRANPHGLTNRELEVFTLLAEGLRNAEIAKHLSTSAKTVEHQVSAILSKLGVRSRAEAITVAHQLGIVSTKVGEPVPKNG